MKENERQGTQNNKVEMGEPNFETDLPKVSNSDQVHLLDSNSDSTEYSRHLEVNNLTVNPENLNISESCKIYTGNDDLEEKFKNWAEENSFDFSKIQKITSLIFLNMSPLHDKGFDDLLFFHAITQLHKCYEEK